MYPKALFTGFGAMVKGANDARYALHGLEFRPDRVAVTDGHRLYIWTPPADREGPEFEPVIVDGAGCVAVGKSLTAHQSALLDVAETERNGHAVFSLPSGTANADKIDGNFPRIENVIPEKAPEGEAVYFNAAYLEDACKRLRAFASDPKGARVSIRLQGPDKPARIDLVSTPDEHTGEAFAVVMPFNPKNAR